MIKQNAWENKTRMDVFTFKTTVTYDEAKPTVATLMTIMMTMNLVVIGIPVSHSMQKSNINSHH
jgi:hypothetical protein